MPGTTHTISSRIKQHPHLIREASLSVVGILLFAGFIHQPFPLLLLAIGGLTGTAAVIGFSIRRISVGEAFGIGRMNRKVLLFCLPALLLGTFLGMFTRNNFEMTLIPAGFKGIVFVAPLVGIAEELVFRGYLQGHLRPVGKIFSIVYASSFHSSYKLLVILTLSVPLQFDFFFLVFWTFIGGLLFGTLRELSRSTIPPLLAHALFDIVLYGGLSTAPVWVWS